MTILSLLTLCLVILVSSAALEDFRGKGTLEDGKIAATEYNALYELYNATDGPSWDWRNLSTGRIPWQFDSTSDPCLDSWQGVNCITVGVAPRDVSYVQTLDLRGRNLSGTLPSSMGELTLLELFNIPHNNISGTLPEEMQKMTHLVHLDIDFNHITGTLPAFLANLTSLRTAILSNNKFSGSIPEQFGSMDSLGILYINSNHLQGTLPKTLGNLSNLAYLDLDTNHLSGTIPVEFRNLTRLYFLGLHSNHLTGTIPAFLGELEHLQFLYLDNAEFHGPIPASLGRLSQLLFLHLFGNMLSGAIPAELGALKNLQYLYLYDNRLEGTVPSELSGLSGLFSLLLQGNQLTGPLDGVFNSTTQRFLTTVQLSNNQFTGELPIELFSLRRLATLVVVSNCFHGSLNEQICESNSLETLVLEGLQSASSCQGFDIPGFTVNSKVTELFQGTIPPCLFQLPHLNTLHLSGNGLSGSLPSDLDVGHQLLDLDLSHNIISGQIPYSIQSRVWYNLDLSYNRLRGELNSALYSVPRNFTFRTQFEQFFVNTSLPVTSAALNLENNRLSGVIPSTVRDMLNISVVQGNLFSCRPDKRDIPSHDEDGKTYQCASNSFDEPYYAWMGFVAAVLCGAAVLWYSRKEIDQRVGVTSTCKLFEEWQKVVSIDNGLPAAVNFRLRNIRYITLICDAIRRITLYCIACILLVLLPLYTVISQYYGTHSKQYTYTVSATFQSGVVPFAVEMVFLGLFMISVGVYFVHNLAVLESGHSDLRAGLSVDQRAQDEVSDDGSVARRKTNRFERFTVRFAFFAINVVVVLGVNIAFVYVALYQSTVLLTVAQILMSVFKFMWNTICNPFLIRWTSHRLSSSENENAYRSRAGFFMLQLFVSLFNNIAIPCLVVGAVDPNCFYNVIVPAESQTSHYVYAECILYTVLGCVQVVPHIASASYSPPFQYSYQCSSSFITYYAPTYVYMAFVVTFVAPAVQLVSRRIHQVLARETIAFRIVDFCLPPVLKPLREGPIKRNIFKPYFDANLILITLLNYLGVMLTFGAVFPPLGAAIAVTICSVAYFAKLKIGRLIRNAVDGGMLSYLDIIQLECRGVGSVRKLRQSAWMLVTFTCLFYMLFLFDTLGNKVGFNDAVWVVFVVPLSPLCVRAAMALHARWYPERPQKGVSMSTTGHAEMFTLSGKYQGDGSSREVSLSTQNTADTVSAMHAQSEEEI